MDRLWWIITSSSLNWERCFPESPHLSDPPTYRVSQKNNLQEVWNLEVMQQTLLWKLFCSQMRWWTDEAVISGFQRVLVLCSASCSPCSLLALKIDSDLMYTPKHLAVDPQSWLSSTERTTLHKAPHGIPFYGSNLGMGCTWLLRLTAC